MENICFHRLWNFRLFYICFILHDNHRRKTKIFKWRGKECTCDSIFVYMFVATGRWIICDSEHGSLLESSNSFRTSFIPGEFQVSLIYHLPICRFNPCTHLLWSCICKNTRIFEWWKWWRGNGGRRGGWNARKRAIG